ncbi:proteinase inhibitor PSI-1.2 [Lolium rigidum]|uniref:proteinase inhibitor PSI-1.2 n=1 Tax=Lolium rigidum TaxID=89674 RepID=UPI001F5C9D5E|nr:proteinase inhibitor PSI-1.2 [Lolium rigidum]
MASSRLALPVALLLCGFLVIGSIHSTGAAEGKICPLFCMVGRKYMTCPSTGCKQLEPACNCCLAGEKGCVIYFSNGNVTRCPRE